ncbi:class I SAM-dependent DNA methyltransferase [Pararhizobium gei]|uniref:class I SAM-dependent DNA methyltransferase n=1 Tax=Pararhizobium gei TaxID=1395951 RepID=UPI0023DB2929|nr:methyltransferase [Rhizobium gei]
MNLNQLSSGSLIADRRAEYAHMLADGGDHAGAADLMAQALELAPDWAAGWFRLSDYEEKSGRKEAAVEALRKVLALNPGDMFGAGLKLAVLGAMETPAGPSSLYVAQLFDDYADRFDRALVEKLDYTVPEKLSELVVAHRGEKRFSCAVDLGCGTGLFGERIRARTDRLEGFDLSANMLSKARDKGIYDRLAEADLSLPPESCGLFDGNDSKSHRADLVSSADVLMYLGSLDAVFAIAEHLLSGGGLFAFSVEDAGEAGEFILRPSLRYAHSKAYVESLCNRFGLTVLEARATIIRNDGGKPVQGILFLAMKPV